ncbi:hypothetical protein [Limnohabitans sp. 15K]|uniref:hypothetical protein n=1 Tax=Limnohabitans sp. 15K TaxID=1100706 RepID=UPI001E5CE604|nr:hypothetical protein [Limnohabitans sp. 15K]
MLKRFLLTGDAKKPRPARLGKGTISASLKKVLESFRVNRKEPATPLRRDEKKQPLIWPKTATKIAHVFFKS